VACQVRLGEMADLPAQAGVQGLGHYV